MKQVNVNSGRSTAQFKIAAVEEKYNAKFVGQLALKTYHGGWSEDSCGDVYYQETPPVEGYSNYFALIVRDGTVYITSGASAVDGIITGIVANDGEIIYSRYRHDFRTSTDGSVYIDGGRDYTKCNMISRCVSLTVIDGEFYKVDET
jgi:outer membrane protein assembly factor BamB